MTGLLDADDLAMLAEGFVAAMHAAPGPAEADAALYELGWGEVLAAAPALAAATAFTALGSTGSAATLLDDVLAHALGLEVTATTCVVLSAPQTAMPPARYESDHLVIDGLVSARLLHATEVVVAVIGDRTIDVVTVDPGVFVGSTSSGVDPSGGYRRVAVTIGPDAMVSVMTSGSWEQAVAAARVALAHQLIGSARWMLDQARQHALDRSQFGRSIASFQAIRHKLADSLVDIEGAAAIAGAWSHDADPLLAAVAKSTAGKASKTVSKHAQQVLAGIGFTTDHAFHLWLRRALVIDTLFGSASSIPTEIGRELLRRRSAPRLVEL
jgi:alkylation response protein AidB-like acyl-CoA dehydrogenase